MIFALKIISPHFKNLPHFVRTIDSTAYVAGQNKRPNNAPVAWWSSAAIDFQTDDRLMSRSALVNKRIKEL